MHDMAKYDKNSVKLGHLKLFIQRSNCCGFSLVEVIAALAILLIVTLPFYQASFHVVSIQKRTELQLNANNLAQAEMERLRNQAVIEAGEYTYEDIANQTSLFTVSRVEDSGDVIPDSGQAPAAWHLKLVFESIRIPLHGDVSKISVIDKSGINRGVFYAGTVLSYTGLICTLNYDNSLTFDGITDLRLGSSILSQLGLDLTQPGTDNGNPGILCVGNIDQSLDLYFSSGYLPSHLPKYEVMVLNGVDNLEIKKWPGTSRDLKVTEKPYSESAVELGYKRFLITVKVYENETLYQSGEIELISLRSISNRLENTNSE